MPCLRAEFTAARPIILNGIEEVITRPDLADRAILLTLAPITEAQRRPENMLWREFEIARPRILGALLDAVSRGLQAMPGVRLERLPRMADFALWATACEQRPPGSFEDAYSNNRYTAVESVIDADPVAAWVRELWRNGRPGRALRPICCGPVSKPRGTPWRESRAAWPFAGWCHEQSDACRQACRRYE
jgi:hypothetical protein